VTLANSVLNIWKTLISEEPRWKELLEAAGMPIDAQSVAAFEASLSRRLNIRRDVRGFEDFAHEGYRGVEPAKPPYSLFYHALASPGVLYCQGRPLRYFPSIEDIDTVENYVYGAKPPSLDELSAGFGGAPLAIVTFAYEYRPSALTVHRKRADMCYSRTGVARVGSEDPCYLRHARGFLPFVGEEAREFEPTRKPDAETVLRAIPCRYAAFLAQQVKGDPKNFGPLRFLEARPQSDPKGEEDGDDHRKFWVPVHKLFQGSECIRNTDIVLDFQYEHLNEKIAKMHEGLRANGFDPGASGAALEEAPFRFREGIAHWDGSHIVPLSRELVKRATDPDGKPIGYPVPLTPYMSSITLWLRADAGNRHWPEYISAKWKIVDHRAVNMAKDKNFVGEVKAGGYDALHFQDFTGDGFLRANCPALAKEVPRSLPAYSIVAPPNFYPLVTQRELADWYDQLDVDLKTVIWSGGGGPAPTPLADVRLPANLGIRRAGFDGEDTTMTAIVSGLGSGGDAQTQSVPIRVRRESSLPDHAAGLFAPGWDTSQDVTKSGTTHLSAHGLASPFPEDTKLCAALAAYWPSASPDTARFYPHLPYGIVTPLPDEYAGWDEVPLPEVEPKSNGRIYQYRAIWYADYVSTALKKRFRMGKIAAVTLEDYQIWTSMMARIFLTLNAKQLSERLTWFVPSYRAVGLKDSELMAAVKEAGSAPLKGRVYRMTLFQGHILNQSPRDLTKLRVVVDRLVEIFADEKTILKREDRRTWTLV
jgi:hypothetical protein